MTKIKKSKLPVLNILWASKESENREVLDFLKPKYDVNILNINDLSHDPDLIIYTGGADVNPELYNEKTGKYTRINKERDLIELNIFNKWYDIPKLGICRGSQLLCSLSGGNIIQHVENHGNSHLITTNRHSKYNNSEYKITSTHHQMMNPFVLSKDQYELIAWSTYFKSPIYLNGDNENHDVDSDFVESEIVYFKKTNSLCIQGHPEFNNCPDNTKTYCLQLIDKYLVKKENKIKNRW